MFRTKVLELFLREKQHIVHYQAKSYLVKKTHYFNIPLYAHGQYF